MPLTMVSGTRKKWPFDSRSGEPKYASDIVVETRATLGGVLPIVRGRVFVDSHETRTADPTDPRGRDTRIEGGKKKKEASQESLWAV